MMLKNVTEKTIVIVRACAYSVWDMRWNRRVSVGSEKETRFSTYGETEVPETVGIQRGLPNQHFCLLIRLLSN